MKKSPDFRAFYNRHPLRLTLNSGAETNIIKASLAKYFGVYIMPSSQTALQADGTTPLTVLGETRITVTRNNIELYLEALVVEELDVDILAGTHFMAYNDVAIRPARNEISIQGSQTIKYGSQVTNNHRCSICRAQVLHAPPTITTIWPGDIVDIAVPLELTDSNLIIEPRYDNPHAKSSTWVKPDIVEAVGAHVCLVNTSNEPQKLSKNAHFCQVLPVVSDSQNDTSLAQTKPFFTPSEICKSVTQGIQLDPDNIMPQHALPEF